MMPRHTIPTVVMAFASVCVAAQMAAAPNLSCLTDGTGRLSGDRRD